MEDVSPLIGLSLVSVEEGADGLGFLCHIFRVALDAIDGATSLYNGVAGVVVLIWFAAFLNLVGEMFVSVVVKVVKEFCPGAQCRYVLSDINDFDSGSYNYIVMCEVLEHLDSPREVLTKVREFLSPMGHLFLTTCANCPAIDHVYLYDSVNDIRQEIGECGYEIVSDLPVAVGDFPENQWKDKKVEINYAALVKRAEK